ncbi:MAG: ribonuclease P protein component [Saprospiraceae bacterium]
MSDHRHLPAERLKSRKAIGLLFKGASSFAVHPLRIIWHVHLAEPGLPQLGFSVPKKRFKKAVDRNRVKRLMLESYRLQKAAFQESVTVLPGRFQGMFLYTSDTIVSYKQVSACMEKLLAQLCVQIQAKKEQ